MSRRSFARRSAAVIVAAVIAPLTMIGSASGAEPVGPVLSQAPAVEQLDRLSVHTDQVASGLRRPTAIAAPDDGSGRLLIAEKPGTVRVYHPDAGLAATPLLDLTDRVDNSANERGLLGIAASPDFAETHALYVAYTSLPDGEVTLSRFPLSDAAQDPVPADGEEVLLTQPHSEFTNHNGGQVAFGPDGHLYWSIGDGGGGGDALNAAQDLTTLLGKILRIDVSASCADAYCIPADNPFVSDAQARPEIWAYGLRNAWRFSFDDADGGLWIADVGQGTQEEVNRLAADQGGANLGWPCLEGTSVFDETRCDSEAEYVDPVFTYATSLEGCAVVGGHVYRGSEFADAAAGVYVTTDYCTATGWGIETADDAHPSAVIGEFPIQTSTFGEDADGELYVANDLPGQLHAVSFELEPPAASCSVDYQVRNQWGTGYIGAVTVVNEGSEPVSDWSLSWTAPAGQTVTSAWSAVVSQVGDQITAVGASWNRSIPPGGSVSFEFLGTHGGAVAVPGQFVMNGSTCR
ncbi:PQQ-dependent sugar dehydrogenase [Actinoalloteichus sp. GBA129-24]|uniref:PQQ-dependent sugar dehydrogenase n=1 Tax=Actinoalloteichus sp. GBA129-24 TaxID=1612551 RepID=UPI0009508880|nr:PQQ-dependent sugar dehydrogenase [Actinoalloteichus sp. GBA129-24]APU19745.1 glucose/sorbosone dehydrogenase [Actinoalloteichus sp. GBA129-24]